MVVGGLALDFYCPTSRDVSPLGPSAHLAGSFPFAPACPKFLASRHLSASSRHVPQRIRSLAVHFHILSPTAMSPTRSACCTCAFAARAPPH